MSQTWKRPNLITLMRERGMGRDLHFRPRGDHTSERGQGTTYNIHFLVLVLC